MDQQAQLIRFPLWGKYKNVRLFLELEETGPKLKRFVFWVHHPRWFFRPKRTTIPNDVSTRTTQARVQDTALELAASLVGMSVKRDFYSQISRTYPRLTKEQRIIRDGLIESTREELRAAFPSKAESEEERQLHIDSRRREERQKIRAILEDLEKQPPEDSLKDNTKADDLVSEPQAPDYLKNDEIKQEK